MFCSECGKQVKDDAKFCGECGAVQSAANLGEKITPKPAVTALHNADRKGTLPYKLGLLYGTNPKIFTIAVAAISLLLLFALLGNKKAEHDFASPAAEAIAREKIAGCDSSNVQLSEITYSLQRDYAYVRGIMKHNCRVAIGPELKWTGYFADGSVAFSTSFWPNSTSNIPANTEFPFEFMEYAKIAPSKFNITVNSVSTW